MENSNYQNWLQTRQQVGWVPLAEATPETWSALGFKCGLEVHQQLKTSRKLFCRCPAGIYHDFEHYDAEIVRHMRPTLSELGGYDGTALMEFKTRKKIVYRIKNDSACTYEVDDTPPFPLNREALEHAMRIALLLKMKIVGELHITRKQYLDGSIPTGFQRTTILGIEGDFPISNKTIRVIQFSIEEDSCREVSDHRHTRVYYADRLGMPLIETVTYPDMLTPWEAKEAGESIRFIARSSGKVRTGIGAARQDVNVSVTGGTRVEIKGVAHLSWIPKLTHNEAFRQQSLLEIRKILAERIADPENWKIRHIALDKHDWKKLLDPSTQNWNLIAVNLPEFKGILSFFNQPGRSFADELADRLKVIACLEKPNLLHNEQLNFENCSDAGLPEHDWVKLNSLLEAGENDAQLIFWAPDEDIKTALETIEERCKLAMQGVPNETRKSLPNGITLFERVLPGADRMYPDTDSAPISIKEEMIDSARKELPAMLADRIAQLESWMVPQELWTHVLRNNLMPVIEDLHDRFGIEQARLAGYYGRTLKSLQGTKPLPFDHQRIADLLLFVQSRSLQQDIIPTLLKLLYKNPNMQFSSLLALAEYHSEGLADLTEQIKLLHVMWPKVKTKGLKREDALQNWIMGKLRKAALGNIALPELKKLVEKEVCHA
jgi:glutamyl-tRNA(Gln) amidotransferase subunit E